MTLGPEPMSARKETPHPLLLFVVQRTLLKGRCCVRGQGSGARVTCPPNSYAFVFPTNGAPVLFRWWVEIPGCHGRCAGAQT